MTAAADRAAVDRNLLARALARLPGLAGLTAADLVPLPLKGVAHWHIALKGRGLLARVPRADQFAVDARTYLAYQRAAFERGEQSGHLPRLVGVIEPEPGLDFGALLVERIEGRALSLPDDLALSAAALAAVHRLAVPPPEARPPLVVHDDPVAGILGFIEAQAAFMAEAHLAPEALGPAQEELAWARRFAEGGPYAAQPVRLVLTDTHPGNFLVRGVDPGKAMFVDVEKLIYGSPAIDCAHHTLVSSTLWDLEQPTILARPAILDFHRRYLALLPPDLSRALIPWLLPLRRLTFLRTLTWAMRWRALFANAAPANAAERAHLEKLKERLGRILAPETIAQARSEWSRADRLGPPFDDRLIRS